MKTIPTDEQIKDCGRQWKEALGISPYRLQADKDFMAGATWMRDLWAEDKASEEIAQTASFVVNCKHEFVLPATYTVPNPTRRCIKCGELE